MSFPWLHQKVSLRTSIAAIGVAVALTIVCMQVCLSIYESKINGDTPAICRLYLEQNPMVHDHFGELQEALFLKDESTVLVNDPDSGQPRIIYFLGDRDHRKRDLKNGVGQGNGGWRFDGERDQYYRRILFRNRAPAQTRKRPRRRSQVFRPDRSRSRFEGFRSASCAGVACW